MEIKRNFSDLGKVVLAIKLLTVIQPLFTNFITVIYGFADYLDVFNLVYLVLFICFAIPTLMKMRFGLICLCLIFIGKFIFGVPWGSEFAAFIFGKQIADSLLEILFFISLFIKKNGIISWVYMLAPMEYLMAHLSTKEQSDNIDKD